MASGRPGSVQEDDLELSRIVGQLVPHGASTCDVAQYPAPAVIHPPSSEPAVRFGHIETVVNRSGGDRIRSEATASYGAPQRSTTTSSSPPAREARVVSRKDSRMLKSQTTVNNLMSLSFTGNGAKPLRQQPADFTAAVLTTRKRLHQINRRMIDPRSPAVRAWDAITMLALLCKLPPA